MYSGALVMSNHLTVLMSREPAGPTDPTSNNNISTSLSTEFTGTTSGRYGRRTVQTVLAAEWMDVLGLVVAGRLLCRDSPPVSFPAI